MMKILDKLNCEVMCLIAAALFGSQLYIMLSSNNSKVLVDFRNMLSVEQQQMYNSITKERMTIFVQGLLLGVLLGFIYLKLTARNVFSACIFTVIVLTVTNLYYMLTPKKKSILPHLETQEKREQWLKVYNSMKRKSIIGTLLGGVSYLLIGLYM